MFRKHSKAIVWMLAVVMMISPSMVYAAAPTGTNQKIDLGYVTPETAAAVVLNPRNVLTAPGMEMLPTEVIQAAGLKNLGIDPLEVEQVLVVAEVAPGAPQSAGIVLVMNSPVDQTKLFPELAAQTSEGQLNGKAYRKANNPMLMSIYCPDEKTIILAHDAMLQKMMANHAAPKEGKMSKVLANFSTPPDILAIVQIEQLRPVLAPMMMMAPLPPQLADVKKLPDLLTSIGAKVNFTGDMSMSLSIKANDAAAAEQVEKILDKFMEATKQQALSVNHRLAASSDPVEQALAKYQKRIGDKMTQVLRPVRKGETLTLAFDPSKNPQGAQIATVGILVALLLPAIQAARAAAQRAQMQNQMNQMPPPMPVQ
jgi:hypothetical protein